MSIDSTQVKLQLTKNKDVLDAAKRRKAVYQDKDKCWVHRFQFDGQTFYAKQGVPIIFSKQVAECIQRNSWIIVGPDIDGEFMPLLEKVAEWKLGEREPDGRNPETCCPICTEDQETPNKLWRHIRDVHNPQSAEAEGTKKTKVSIFDDKSIDVSLRTKPKPQAEIVAEADEATDEQPEPEGVAAE